MVTSLTLFKSTFDNKTHRKMSFHSWSDFSSLLFHLSKQERKGKKDAELISPATYVDGTTRANRNVLAWAGWAAIDVDDYEFEGDLKDDLVKRFGNYNFICYSTASSTLDQPKFRLVFELERQVEQSEIKHFWWSLNKQLEDIGDAQTKDLSRMYYIPAKYVGAHNFIFDNIGYPIDVDHLMAKWPYDRNRDSKNFLDRLPPELQAAVLEYKQNKLTNTTYSWSGYRDCPFWPKDLAAEYQTITNTGWYAKMYAIMVKIAGNATYRGYPIQAFEIADLCKQFDQENGNWYENRPMETEADRALEYIMRNGKI